MQYFRSSEKNREIQWVPHVKMEVFAGKIPQILGQLQLSLEEKVSCIHAMKTKRETSK